MIAKLKYTFSCGLLALGLLFIFGTLRSDTIPLDKLKPGLTEMFESFLVAEPENYDYTVNTMSGDDIELTGWIIREIERVFEAIKYNRWSKAEITRTSAKLNEYLWNADMNELSRREKARYAELLKRVPNAKPPSARKKSHPGIWRFRKNGNNYRCDNTIDIHLSKLTNPDHFKWKSSTADFFDEEHREFREWYIFDHNSQKISLSKSRRQRGEISWLGDEYGWRGFYMDESVAAILLSLVFDETKVQSTLKFLKSKIESLTIEDFPVNKEQIGRLIDNTHSKTIVTAREAGDDLKFVLLDFTNREHSSYPYLSLICDRNDLLRPYIAIRRNPKTGVTQTCSLRDYRDDGALRFYGYCETLTPETARFETMIYLTSLHHTKPGPEIFEFRVPEGWTWMDKTDPSKAVFYDENGEIMGEKIYNQKKSKTNNRLAAVFGYLCIFALMAVAVWRYARGRKERN